MSGDREPVLRRHPRYRPPVAFRTCRPVDVHQPPVVAGLREQVDGHLAASGAWWGSRAAAGPGAPVDDRLTAGRVWHEPSGDEPEPVRRRPPALPGPREPADDSPVAPVCGPESAVPPTDTEGGRS